MKIIMNWISRKLPIFFKYFGLKSLIIYNDLTWIWFKQQLIYQIGGTKVEHFQDDCFYENEIK